MKDNKINKQFLNKALRNGDEKAFQIVFDNYYEKLFAFINSYTNNNAQTKDILQETFIKFWNKRESIKDNLSVLAFLHKISYNTFIDGYRKNKREKELLDSFTYQKLTNLLEEDEEFTNYRIERVKKIIQELPPRCKEIFEMSKFKGLKYSEIAEELSISVKTVEAQMGKAYAVIRDKFTK